MVYWNLKLSSGPGEMLHSFNKFMSTSFLTWWEGYIKNLDKRIVKAVWCIQEEGLNKLTQTSYSQS